VIFKYNTATASGVDLLTLVASYYYPMRMMMMHSVSLLEWREREGGRRRWVDGWNWRAKKTIATPPKRTTATVTYSIGHRGRPATTQRNRAMAPLPCVVVVAVVVVLPACGGPCLRWICGRFAWCEPWCRRWVNGANGRVKLDCFVSELFFGRKIMRTRIKREEVVKQRAALGCGGK